jgi:pimeloyl-ACP methyl ester carboxylesterase
MGRVKSVVRVAVALLVIVAAAPASASARTLKPCERDSIIYCGQVPVPLDRSGRVPGQVKLSVEHAQVTPQFDRRGRDDPNGAIFALAGGPGQPATQFTSDFLFAFSILGGEPAVPRDIVTFDQRGTGASGLLRCPEVEKVTLLSRYPEAGQRCAERLGDRRGLYTTSDSVDDMEAVRQAIGADKIVIYGASYGTKVALLYAARYPEHVERLILDSVLTEDGPDPLYRDTFAAMPRVARASCGSECDWTADPAADLSAVTGQLGAGPLRGFVVDRRGRPRAQSIGSTRLFFLMVGGDFAPRIRAALPAALHNARRGDPAPLLRLAAVSEAGVEPASPRDFSVAIFAATVCEEAAFPWRRGAAFDDRERETTDTIAALGESAFAPFGSGAVVQTDLIQLCRRWSEAGPAPAAPGPLPDVPALLLEGQMDLRTPLEGAQRVAAQLPHSRLLTIPATGHSTLGSDTSSCTLDAITRFLERRSVRATCPHPPELQPPDTPAPLSLDEVKPATRRVPEPVARVVEALDLTLNDVEDQVATQAVLSFSSGDAGAVRGGGLRAGHFRAGEHGVSLEDVVYVPGLSVSGRLLNRSARIGSFRLSGSRAVAGRVDYHGGGIVTGRIGGHDFRIKLRRAELTAPEIELGKKKLLQPEWPKPKFG